MNDSWKRNVCNWCWNDRSVDAETTVLVVSSRSVRWQLEKLDGGKFERRYVQAIGVGRAECLSTRFVSDTSEWSQVSQRGIVKNFVAQYCNLILYMLRDPQPVKAEECISDVVGALWIEDQPCCCIHQTKKPRAPLDSSQPPFWPKLLIAPKISWTLSPFDLFTYTKFGPDLLRFAGLIPERLIFRPKKSVQYRLSGYNYLGAHCHRVSVSK